MRFVSLAARGAQRILRSMEKERGGREDAHPRGASVRDERRSGFRGAFRCLSLVMAIGLLWGCSSTHNPGPGSSPAEKEAVGPAAEKQPEKLANYTESIPGPDGTVVTFDMIAVPGGTFLMGSPDSEEGRKEDEGPQHEVAVGPFWIGKTEVSWTEYDAFRAVVPQTPKGEPGAPYEVDAITGPTSPYGDPYRGFGGGSRCAIDVGWYGAMVYCKWLTKVTGKLYRLPTEAEWEYGCRAGSKGMFCFGDDPAKLGEYGWYRANSEHETHPVGTKKPNAWGIHDMHGNVPEWCLDWYVADYYGSFAPEKWPADPKGPEKGMNHVVRGGMFESKESQLRCASRDRSYDWWLDGDPNDPKSNWWVCQPRFVGFRIIRPLRGEKPKMPDIPDGRKAL